MNGEQLQKEETLPRKRPLFIYDRKIVIKGIDFTEKIDRSKGLETVQHWRLKKPRSENDVGIWVDGRKEATYSDMVNGFDIMAIKWSH